MSDRFYRISLQRLLRWILDEAAQDRIFSIYKEQFFTPSVSDPFRSYRYGQLLETPLGVAAGPQTQMAQNIVVAWLTGSRYIELKTIQTLDELEITKPCIDMEDEGYNCEWSQELKIKDTFDEYLNAWILLHILQDKLNWQKEDGQDGFIFNISVGYDLQGIRQPNVQWFLDKVQNCEQELEEKIEEVKVIYPPVVDLPIASRLSDNVTLSTMHGCPPREIEAIARYLMEERGLHTVVKLNPTLLGARRLRHLLNEELSYTVTVPDEAFEHDLKYDDALKMIRNLQKVARSNQVEFGLKLTNTLETRNINRHLPQKERMTYLSGRALHPISIHLAARLQNDFKGKLDISFSGGADAFNVARVLACNLKPVTVCSDLLKPGGYTRSLQYLENIRIEMQKLKAHSVHELILNKAGGKSDLPEATLHNLQNYAEVVRHSQAYKKDYFKYQNIKTSRPLTSFDCIHAPCIESCAISQDVPEYMYYTARGQFDLAYEAILRTNPLPHITGMVCDHLCQAKCTRLNYDHPLLIREIKRFVSETASDHFNLKAGPANGQSVAIIGAGPSGLSAAYFLALAGFAVQVFEAHATAGGMVAYAIPGFRIRSGDIEADIAQLKILGIDFHFHHKVNSSSFRKLQEKFDFIYIAVGARKGKHLNISGEDLPGVYDQLRFLKTARQQKISIGQNVIIIGGGNSAMDAARTAKRLTGSRGRVTVVYRRTVREMPADREEIAALQDEGIQILELSAPVEIKHNKKGRKIIHCLRMRLAEADESGRPRPEPVSGSDFELEADTVISAIGQEVDLDFLTGQPFRIDPLTRETGIENVYAGGDALRGADSLINAIADGKIVAERIIQKVHISRPSNLAKRNSRKEMSAGALQALQAHRQFGPSLPEIPVRERFSFKLVHPTLGPQSAMEEAKRCLLCDEICNICVSVCPNLSNMPFDFEQQTLRIPMVRLSGRKFTVTGYETFRIEQKHQIINLADFCNECGNCTTFCPTDGAPYQTKPRFYLTRFSFEAEEEGFYLQDDRIEYKYRDRHYMLQRDQKGWLYESPEVYAEWEADALTLSSVRQKATPLEGKVSFKKFAEMYLLYQNLHNQPVFRSNTENI